MLYRYSDTLIQFRTEYFLLQNVKATVIFTEVRDILCNLDNTPAYSVDMDRCEGVQGEINISLHLFSAKHRIAAGTLLTALKILT